jgi:hypothetical protein
MGNTSSLLGGYFPSIGVRWDSNRVLRRLDQTTRIHGAILTGALQKSVWHEISRPQVHGYDMLGAAFIDPLKFVSIADEKVARVFEAPRGFVQLAQDLGISKFSDDEVCYGHISRGTITQGR